jgi:hypothetical protein
MTNTFGDFRPIFGGRNGRFFEKQSYDSFFALTIKKCPNFSAKNVLIIYNIGPRLKQAPTVGGRETFHGRNCLVMIVKFRAFNLSFWEPTLNLSNYISGFNVDCPFCTIS